MAVVLANVPPPTPPKSSKSLQQGQPVTALPPVTDKNTARNPLAAATPAAAPPPPAPIPRVPAPPADPDLSRLGASMAEFLAQVRTHEAEIAATVHVHYSARGKSWLARAALSGTWPHLPDAGPSVELFQGPDSGSWPARPSDPCCQIVWGSETIRPIGGGIWADAPGAAAWLLPVGTAKVTVVRPGGWVTTAFEVRISGFWPPLAVPVGREKGAGDALPRDLASGVVLLSPELPPVRADILTRQTRAEGGTAVTPERLLASLAREWAIRLAAGGACWPLPRGLAVARRHPLAAWGRVLEVTREPPPHGLEFRLHVAAGTGRDFADWSSRLIRALAAAGHAVTADHGKDPALAFCLKNPASACVLLVGPGASLPPGSDWTREAGRWAWFLRQSHRGRWPTFAAVVDPGAKRDYRDAAEHLVRLAPGGRRIRDCLTGWGVPPEEMAAGLAALASQAETLARRRAEAKAATRRQATNIGGNS